MKKSDLRQIIKEEIKLILKEVSINTVEDSDTNEDYTVTDDIIYLSPDLKDGKGWEKLSIFNKRVSDPESIKKANETKLKKGTKLTVKSNTNTGNKIATLQGGGKSWNIVKPSTVKGNTLEKFLKK